MRVIFIFGGAPCAVWEPASAAPNPRTGDVRISLRFMGSIVPPPGREGNHLARVGCGMARTGVGWRTAELPAPRAPREILQSRNRLKPLVEFFPAPLALGHLFAQLLHAGHNLGRLLVVAGRRVQITL